MPQLTFRQATFKDVDFIIQAIIEAEKSGSDKISYCTLFDLSLENLQTALKEILSEDFEGQQLCVSGFQIAAIEGKNVGTCCTWIEGFEGMSSAIITGSLLGEYFPQINFQIGAEKSELLKTMSIEREKGTLQIESVFTLPEFRGKGIFRELLKQHIKNQLIKKPDLNKAQIILAESNKEALAAYQKSGFSFRSKVIGDTALLEYLPSNIRLLLELPIKS